VSYRRLFVLVLLLFVWGALRRAQPVSADESQPIPPQELEMTGLPEAPDAPAVFLYRQVDGNDLEDNYIFRSCGILSEEIFTKRAVFKPYDRPPWTVPWSWPAGLPQGTEPPKEGPDDIVRTTTETRISGRTVMPQVLTEFRFPPEFHVSGKRWTRLRTSAYSLSEIRAADRVIINQDIRKALIAKV
jgi:hypothetical protein